VGNPSLAGKAVVKAVFYNALDCMMFVSNNWRKQNA
jgi:hypothetical protein